MSDNTLDSRATEFLGWVDKYLDPETGARWLMEDATRGRLLIAAKLVDDMHAELQRLSPNLYHDIDAVPTPKPVTENVYVPEVVPGPTGAPVIVERPADVPDAAPAPRRRFWHAIGWLMRS